VKKTDIKSSIIDTPVLGYTLRMVTFILRGPKIRKEMNERILSMAASVSSIESSQKTVLATLTNVQDDYTRLSTMNDNIEKRFSILEEKTNKRPLSVKSGMAEGDSDLFAEDHLLDVFYTNFEDKFRGSEEVISKRLEEYSNDFKNSRVDFNKYPVLDIGSGRGEFLQLMKSYNIPAIGLDINIDMVNRSNGKGLNTELGDALTYLRSQKPRTLWALPRLPLV